MDDAILRSSLSILRAIKAADHGDHPTERFSAWCAAEIELVCFFIFRIFSPAVQRVNVVREMSCGWYGGREMKGNMNERPQLLPPVKTHLTSPPCLPFLPSGLSSTLET